MTFDDSLDVSADSLDRLKALAPDPDRAERVRVRCLKQLERRSGRAARTAVITGFAWDVLAPGVVAAFCVFYVVMLVATTLRVFQ